MTRAPCWTEACRRAACASRAFVHHPARAALPGRPMRLPHIRLDRALEFLIGDRFG